MSASLKSVVVVGGGAAGSVIAKQLAKQKTAKVTLVNPVPYRVLLPATIRMVVSDIDDLENQALVPLDRVFEEPSSPGTFIQAKVLNVHPEQNKLQLDNGEELAYDILVLATGSKWNEPIDFPDDAEGTKTFIRAQREKIAAAKSIVLVGGGAVGIETAGEIRDIYPEKEITIVHSYNQLLNTAYPDKVRSAAAQAMVSRNIKLVLDDAVDFDTGSDTKTTRRGHTLTADLVLNTTGGKPNTSFLPSSTLNESGYVKVKPTLQLIDHPNILAAGDILDWNEQKQAAKTAPHAAVVVSNVNSLLNGGSSALKEYAGSTEMIIVTNGKYSGFGYIGLLWGISVGTWLARAIKSKGLMVGMMRGSVGY